MNTSRYPLIGMLSLATRLPKFILLLSLFGLVTGLTNTEAQTLLCPDFGDNKIVLENDAQSAFSNPRLQVLGENIFVSGSFDNDNNKYQILKIKKTGTINPVFSNLTVSPMATGGGCNTKIGTKVLSNGDFLIYWYSGTSGCTIQDAYFKILSATGSEVKATQKINTNSEASRLVRNVEVEQLSNGNVAFVYATSDKNYALRRITEAGQFVDNQEISITNLLGLSGQAQYTHRIAANKNGNFLIFMDYYSIRYKAAIFDNGGASPKTVKDISAAPSYFANVEKRPLAKALPNGDFLLAYQVRNGDLNSSIGLAFQILKPDGTTAKAEQRLPEYYDWGGFKEPVLVNDGFLIDYFYNDLGIYGPRLGKIPYLIKYDFSGNKIEDLNAGCTPTIVDQFAEYAYFTDFDGDLGFYSNDKPQASASKFDFSLIRRNFGPVVLIDNVQILSNSSVKVEADLGGPADLVVSEKGLIYVDTLIS